MNVPLLDLKAQYQAIKAEIDAAVVKVLESQYFILGPEVDRCEGSIADYCQAGHAVGVGSGSDALLIALMAENIGPGDEVICPSYTFFATGGSIYRTGAKPVWVDIDPVTFNMDPQAFEAAITPKTRAVIPVHLYGQAADMDAILPIARKHDLIVIEDAAQAIGAELDGQRAGSFGDYGCFSFFPTKNLGGGGEGGIVTTQDAGKDHALRLLRNHGMEPRYYHKLVGGNFRLDAIQAAIINVKLRHLDSWTAGRQANAEFYNQAFANAGLLDDRLVQLPSALPDRRHVWNQYIVRVQKRDELRTYMAEHGVGSEVYYPVPLHLQECFAPLGGKAGDLPVTEKACEEVLALPIFPELTEEQLSTVVTTIASFYGK